MDIYQEALQFHEQLKGKLEISKDFDEPDWDLIKQIENSK